MNNFSKIILLIIAFKLVSVKCLISQENIFKIAEVYNMLKLNSTNFTNKYPNLTLIGDVPHFHRNYLVNIFYFLSNSTLQSKYNDSATSCLTGVGLNGFKVKAKPTDKAILLQLSEKDKLLSLEEELVGQKFELINKETTKMFFIKKYKKQKMNVHVILYSPQKRVEMGSCFRVYFFYD